MINLGQRYFTQTNFTKYTYMVSLMNQIIQDQCDNFKY